MFSFLGSKRVGAPRFFFQKTRRNSFTKVLSAGSRGNICDDHHIALGFCFRQCRILQQISLYIRYYTPNVSLFLSVSQHGNANFYLSALFRKIYVVLWHKAGDVLWLLNIRTVQVKSYNFLELFERQTVTRQSDSQSVQNSQNSIKRTSFPCWTKNWAIRNGTWLESGLLETASGISWRITINSTYCIHRPDLLLLKPSNQ